MKKTLKVIQRSFVDTLKKRLQEAAPLIQLVLGPRQVGKTTGVHQFLDSIKTPYNFVNADDQLSFSSGWLLEQWQMAMEQGRGALLVIKDSVFGAFDSLRGLSVFFAYYFLRSL